MDAVGNITKANTKGYSVGSASLACFLLFSAYLDEVEMTSRYREEHDLMGISEKSIFAFDPDFTQEDISSLEYPDDSTLLKHGIRGIYLGNYLRWDPVSQHNSMRIKYGFV